MIEHETVERSDNSQRNDLRSLLQASRDRLEIEFAALKLAEMEARSLPTGEQRSAALERLAMQQARFRLDCLGLKEVVRSLP